MIYVRVYCLCFFSKSFIVSSLIFKPLPHFEFILCVDLGGVLVSSFHVQLSSYPIPLIEEAVSLHCIFLPSLSKVRFLGLSLSLGFLSCSVGLYFCFCGSTILS